jgi:DNA-binding PadR family transcriptional regulator
MSDRRSLSEPSYFVLAALLDGPLHGYGIIKKAEAQSSGRVRLTAGTLYGALDRLADRGLVTVTGEERVAGRTRRYYRLTDAGTDTLEQEASRMEQAARLVTERRRTATRPSIGPAPA